MKKMINAIETNGMGGVNTLIMEFAVEPKCVNLVEAVCKASLDFVNSSKGREVYEKNNKSFNWGDFWIHVPNSFCQRYGFTFTDDLGNASDNKLHGQCNYEWEHIKFGDQHTIQESE